MKLHKFLKLHVSENFANKVRAMPFVTVTEAELGDAVRQAREDKLKPSVSDAPFKEIQVGFKDLDYAIQYNTDDGVESVAVTAFSRGARAEGYSSTSDGCLVKLTQHIPIDHLQEIVFADPLRPDEPLPALRSTEAYNTAGLQRPIIHMWQDGHQGKVEFNDLNKKLDLHYRGYVYNLSAEGVEQLHIVASSCMAVGIYFTYMFCHCANSDKYLVKVDPAPTKKRKKGAKLSAKAKSHLPRSHYIYLDKAPEQVRPTDRSEVGSESVTSRKSGHHRRAHWRTMVHRRFRHHPHYGERIRIKASWIGPTQWSDNRAVYTVQGLDTD